MCLPPNLERKLLTDYFELFVNRRAYTLQAVAGKAKEGRCYYYRPKDDRYLCLGTIRGHLFGEVTVGLYAINPATQRCKWVAIDADYREAINDLLRLQWELRNDGVDSAFERSRRGGHLWVFAQGTLLAAECRRYVQNLAARVRAGVGKREQQPTAGSASIEGIEIFPKQDRVSASEFGNAIRAPLGVHRRDGKRYWFYGADYSIEAQLDYLQGLGKLSQEKITKLLSEIPVVAREGRAVIERGRNSGGFIADGSLKREFSILSHLGGRVRKAGRNYFTQCPACARRGRDKHGDNLAISVTEPRKYRCWAGCTKEEIRAAVGLRTSHIGWGKS